jgi:ElaB/YqjD/DUF883 family membrane-anchored ribosome-binding protein
VILPKKSIARSAIMSRVESQADAVGNAASKVSDKAQEVTQNLRDFGTHAADVAQQKYGEVRDRAADYYNRSKDAAQDWEQSLESYVQEKPLQAVLIAAGVGLILGLIWRRH